MMVLRRESFAGHTLPSSVSPRRGGLVRGATGYGYFAAMPSAPRPPSLAAAHECGGLGGFAEESAVIGTIQALALRRPAVRQPVSRVCRD